MRARSRTARYALIGAVALAIAGALLFATRGVQAATTPEAQPAAGGCDPARTLQVSGSATVNVAPDRALIRLGVQSSASTIDAVESANSAAIQKVLDTLLDQDVQAKDISTDIYVIEPLYDDDDSLSIKGYRISNEVAVTVRNVQQTSALISAALKAGANQVNSVEFYTSELRQYRDQARELAATAAREKAQALASSAGAQAGCVLDITENSWASYNGGGYGRSLSLWTQNTVQNIASAEGASSPADEPISLGMISVRAEVSATYSLN